MDTAIEVAKPKKIGAPTSYRDEYPAMLVEYFEAAKMPSAEPQPEEPPSGKGSHRAALMQVYQYLPTFEGFGRLIKTPVSTMQEWKGRHPAFAAAYARAKDIQREHFAVGLVTGAMNPTGAIFAAKNLVGWKDKTEIETTVSADVVGMEHMRKVLSSASPDQLQRFASLMEEIEAGVPKQIESSQ